MTKKQLFIFILLGVFAGIAIGLGGMASLLANNLMPGIWGKLIGSVLFSIGLFVVITYGMKLFTGMVAGIPEMGAKNWWQLAVCFLANAVGMGIVALLGWGSFLGETLVAQSQTLVAGKLAAENWAVATLCSSIFCGLLITISVWSGRYASEKKLSVTFGVVIPVVVFVFCGFDHSVANLLYLFLNGQISWQIVGYEAIAIVGNIIGGVAFPLFAWMTKK